MRFDRFLAWRPFAAERGRIDAAVAALERGAAAAEAERRRLAEATAVAHQALAVLHDRLVAMRDQAARADAALLAVDAGARTLVEAARVELAAAAMRVGTGAVDRVGQELAPLRDAAQAHAVQIRASIDRMHAETAALDGAASAAAVLVDLAGTTHRSLQATLAAPLRSAQH